MSQRLLADINSRALARSEFGYRIMPSSLRRKHTANYEPVRDNRMIALGAAYTTAAGAQTATPMNSSWRTGLNNASIPPLR